MSKVRKAPSEIASKQIRRLQDSTTDIEAGINRVTVSPCDLAADNLDKAGDNYMKAIRSGKMERGLRAVTAAEWKKAALAKVDRIGQGIEESRAKLEQFHKQRNAAQDAIDAKLDAMPTRTIDDNIRRMVTQVKAMSELTFDKSQK